MHAGRREPVWRDFAKSAARALAKLAARGWAGLRRGCRWGLAAAGRLLVAGRARLLREPGGGRPITVVDQASAGAKLRLVLVEVDGQRVLLAASGDQVPAMLALAPAERQRPQRPPRQTAKMPAAGARRQGMSASGRMAESILQPDPVLPWSDAGRAHPALGASRVASGAVARAAARSEIQ